jgi:hypothetical protein
MQLELQHADPHDAIAAQLRRLAPRHEQDSAVPDAVPVAQGTTAPPSEPVNEPSLRAVPLNDNAGDILGPISPTRSGYRGARVLLAICAIVVAVIAWRSYGEEAKQRLSHLAPHLLAGAQALAQSVTAAKPQDAATPVVASQPAVEPAPAQDGAAATSTQPSTAAVTPAVESPPTQAAISPELASSIESMAGEIASLKQTVDELKAGQQQMERDIAKAAEHEAHRKPIAQTSKPTPPPRRQHVSTSAATVRARAPYVPPQNYSQQAYPQSPVQRDAYVPPPAPAQLPPQPGDTYAPRPPMPLR